MQYYLKQYDIPLLQFSADANSSNPDIVIEWINESYKHLLPLDLKLNNEGIAHWLKQRSIPKNRAFVHDILAKCGFSINRPLNVITVSKGLSLNDCYWVVEKDFTGHFADYNLYDNRFSQILAVLAFTGYGSTNRYIHSSPEFTTNGILPKCWRRINGNIFLYKGGTIGASNAGNEPYSEYYAYQIANAMNINAVSYSISKWKNIICSTCELFTSKDVSFIPVGRIVTSGGITAVEKYYESLGEEYVSSLHDMYVFDALICNTDRHFGNFGFLIDNKENKIISPAPLFDHGNSLLNFAREDYFASTTDLESYISTLLPCTYDSFMEKAYSVLNNKHREQLRHLLDFHFTPHPRYNLSAKRRKMLETVIHNRAKKLLEYK